jgi:hypothetical protein
MRIWARFRVRIQGFDEKLILTNFTDEQKIAFNLSLDFYERRPSYRKSLQTSKENTQHFIT